MKPGMEGKERIEEEVGEWTDWLGERRNDDEVKLISDIEVPLFQKQRQSSRISP